MKISVWYHCILSGPRISDPNHALSVLQEQMRALKESDLADRANEIHVGVNGDNGDAILAGGFCNWNTKLHVNGKDAKSEIPTLNLLRDSLKPGWLVLYHHMKGASAPGVPVVEKWRRCMERVCVWGWRECIKELENGADSVGAHWMSHRKYSIIHPSQRYWGGNFWWATSEYLMTLPPLADDTQENRYEAEVWIGKSKHSPAVVDFAPHFPMLCP